MKHPTSHTSPSPTSRGKNDDNEDWSDPTDTKADKEIWPTPTPTPEPKGATTADVAVLAGLIALDAEIRKSSPGEPGTGIYALLEGLAASTMGVPRGTYPASLQGAPAPPAKATK
jgi:hypothetical protein